MTMLGLYLRSRRVLRSAATVLSVAGLIWFFLWLTRSQAMTMLIATIFPLGIAAVLGASTGTPFGELEQTASRPMRASRLIHFGALLLLGTLALFVAGTASPLLDAQGMLARNALGYSGLALLAARFVGPARSWMVPLVYGGSAFASGSESHWAWPIHPAADQTSLAIALALALAGLLATITRR